uniref:BCL10 immune signaling adaptor n=1 Tax=Astyanax mexicanus TaxID=7994 RepID=A0A3B1K6P0_ASTMX
MDASHLTEDEMAEVKKEVRFTQTELNKPNSFVLNSKKILTREDTEEISCRSTRGKRAGKLLDLLSENPRGLDTLIESIQRCRTLNFIIVKITDEVQRVKNEKLEALKGYSGAKYPSSGATNDLSKSDLYDYDKCSTMCLHPDGEGSSASSVTSSSLNLRCISGQGRGRDPPSVASLNVSSTSSCLPKPGDPGAPPLPDELEAEGGASDAGACGSTGSSGDANFQPLRSRTLTPSVRTAL